MIDTYFPPNGPCAFCGDEKTGARHRLIEAIAGTVQAGDSLDDAAEAYGVSRDAALFAVAFTEGQQAR